MDVIRKVKNITSIPSNIHPISTLLINNIMLFCPCGLLRNEVLDLDQRDRVILREGRCQNLLANGGEGVCGQPLGAHPLAQGNSILIN